MEDWRECAVMSDVEFERWAGGMGFSRRPGLGLPSGGVVREPEGMADFRRRVIDAVERGGDRIDWRADSEVMAVRKAKQETRVVQFPDDPDRLRIEFDDGHVLEGSVIGVSAEQNATGGDHVDGRVYVPLAMRTQPVVMVLVAVKHEMPSYPSRWRKLPIVVEAVQWTGDNLSVVREFVGDDALAWTARDELGIKTLEGVLHASKGDWIVKGAHGEFYPVKPEVWADTYEEVEPDEE